MNNINKYTQILVIIIIIISFFYFINNYLNYNSFEIENFDNNNIPKIIIQTWKTKEIPEKYKKDVASLKKLNPDFKFLFFTDDDIENFLKKNYPEYYKIYLKLPVKIQKIDYFRYIAIYHYGGFYFDLDMAGYKSIKNLVKYNCVFPVDQNIPDYKCFESRFENYCKNNLKFILGQYAFGAKQSDPFLKELIDNINSNIDNYIKYFKVNGSSLQYIYSSTGPDFVTDIYINSKNKDNVHILRYRFGQHFGKYARHRFYGTWKNKKKNNVA